MKSKTHKKQMKKQENKQPKKKTDKIWKPYFVVKTIILKWKSLMMLNLTSINNDNNKNVTGTQIDILGSL